MRFARNQQAQDAVIRNIEIIGEAANRVQREQPELVMAHPELPWIEMRGMRNKMIHNYFDVSLEIVWATVKNALAQAKTADRRFAKAVAGTSFEHELSRFVRDAG